MSRQTRHHDAKQTIVTPPTKAAVNAWNQYVRWCEANDQPVLPAHMPGPDDVRAEQVLLRFLHAHLNRWSWSTVRNYGLYIATEQMRQGRPDPRGRRTTAYLGAVRRAKGSRQNKPTDALSGSQVVASSERQATYPVAPVVTRLRGLAATAIVLGLDPTATVDVAALWRLPATAFRVTDLDVRIIRPDGTRGLVGQDRDPLLYAAITAALTLAGDALHPFAARADELPDRKNKRTTFEPNIDAVKTREAWARAVPDARRWTQHDGGGLKPVPRVVSRQYAASSQEDRMWFLANLDPRLAQRRRDLCYALHGIVTGHRHAEHARLTIDHIVQTANGYTHTLLEDKGNIIAVQRGGKARPVTHDIDHLADDTAECPPWCPACALRDHLEVRHRNGAAPGDPLYISYSGPAVGQVLGLQGATLAVQRFWALADGAAAVDDGTNPVIGTRTMRVTAASMGRQQGMSLLEIAETLTGHRSINHARLYVRRVDPFTTDLVLPVE